MKRKFLRLRGNRVPLIEDEVFELMPDSVESLQVWLSIQNRFQANVARAQKKPFREAQVNLGVRRLSRQADRQSPVTVGRLLDTIDRDRQRPTESSEAYRGSEGVKSKKKNHLSEIVRKTAYTRKKVVQ